MLKRLLLPIALVALAVGLVACGEDEAPGDPGPATPTPAAADDGTPAPTPTPAAADDDDDEGDFEPFEFAEGESVFDLADVNSFRQRWSITFSGPGAEETGQAGTFEMFAEYVRDPIAARVQMTDQQGAIAFEVVRIQEQAWFGGEGMPWQEVPAGSVPFDPSDMMMMGGAFFAPDAATGMDGLFARVDTEELNGRQTVHYSMDVTDLFALMRQTDPTMSDAELTDGRLDYWVDQSGRFIVKYEMVIEGSGLDADFDDFDDDELTTDQPMRMEMVFELFDFGADINIEPPQ